MGDSFRPGFSCYRCFPIGKRCFFRKAHRGTLKEIIQPFDGFFFRSGGKTCRRWSGNMKNSRYRANGGGRYIMNEDRGCRDMNKAVVFGDLDTVMAVKRRILSFMSAPVIVETCVPWIGPLVDLVFNGLRKSLHQAHLRSPYSLNMPDHTQNRGRYANVF